jgi:hypothetical protein
LLTVDHAVFAKHVFAKHQIRIGDVIEFHSTRTCLPAAEGSNYERSA